jgi:REP element-mobilizing transposase RayT
MNKFRNKYRIPSARAQWWDYRRAGAYFITICTQNRVHYFGEIENGQMRLSEIGKIAETEWLKTFELRPDMNLYQGEFVVMPNHFHAIIGIGQNEFNTPSRGMGRDAMHCVSTFELRPDMNLYQGEFVVMPNHFHAIIGIGENEFNTPSRGMGRDAMHCVSTPHEPHKPHEPHEPHKPHEPHEPHEPHKPQNQFGPQSKNLASVVRGFKSSVTIAARKINPDFAWQTRFHDHIIRNDESFENISNYIINNPANWQEDKFFKSK